MHTTFSMGTLFSELNPTSLGLGVYAFAGFKVFARGLHITRTSPPPPPPSIKEQITRLVLVGLRAGGCSWQRAYKANDFLSGFGAIQFGLWALGAFFLPVGCGHIEPLWYFTVTLDPYLFWVYWVSY